MKDPDIVSGIEILKNLPLGGRRVTIDAGWYARGKGELNRFERP